MDALTGSSNVALVTVDALRVYFPVRRNAMTGRQKGWIKAVDGVSFEIKTGETLGLVGESGCGKSTTGRAILQLHRPTAGSVLFRGHDLTRMSGQELHRMRRKMQLIFQDPYASLNPRMKVGKIISEPLEVQGIGTKGEREGRVQELLRFVGLNPDFAMRYPHAFSGGQRQRIGIARALAVNPEFIVCDEPISALDVSIKSQILNLLIDLQLELALTYLFIAHDLAAVRHISDRIAVMYLGKLMELADRDTLYDQPLHPYTRALIASIPIPDPEAEEKRERFVLKGDVASPANPPSGCVFRTRCPLAFDKCTEEVPEWRNLGSVDKSHWVACHIP